MNEKLKSVLSRLHHDRRGSMAVMMAAATLLFVGIGAVVVDIGYLFHVRSILQASADKAALAGAQDINCCKNSPGKAVTTAISYSAVKGNMNADPKLNITMESGYPSLRCFTSTGIPCSGPDSANGIVVKQQTDVPVFFARIFGSSSLPISVTSVAGKGGAVQPADVVIILDTTGSMNSIDPSCSIAGSTRLDCAFAGFRALLAGFSSSTNRVGLMVFPGLTSAAAAAQEYDCSSATPPKSALAPYNASPVYSIIPLSNNYQNANGTLNTNSNLVKAARGGASGCTAGVTALGGVGTYYADVVTVAADYLNANARPDVQKMIIFLGDGDANGSEANVGKSKVNNQCHQAITAAQQAKAKKISVVTIAYGAPTGTKKDAIPSCTTDNAAGISACSTLQQMASDPKNFYSDTVGGTSACTSAANPATDLTAIFLQIVTSLSGARLFPDDTM